TRAARMPLRAAELLVVALLAGRHLDQRRSAEEDLRALLDHDDVVAHAGDIGAPGRRVAEDQRDGRDLHRGLARQVAKAATARDEDLALRGQVCTAGLDQVDDW